MPATRPLATVADFLLAGGQAVQGQHGSTISVRRGGIFDLALGSSAVLWGPQAQRVRDLFQQAYLNLARPPAVDRIGERLYQVERHLATTGAGIAVLQRAAGGDAGDIWAGSRVEVRQHPDSEPNVYRVIDDVSVADGETVIAVPIEATRKGPGVAVNTSTPSQIKIADTLFDTFTPISVVCEDGEIEETPAAFIARGKAAQLDRRVGFPVRVKDTCKAAGAVNVVILDAGAFEDSDDASVTNVYVADASYHTTDPLKEACFLALEDVRVAGCDLQVLGMDVVPVTLDIVATMSGPTSLFNLPILKSVCIRALLDAFNRRPEFWVFALDALVGELHRAAGNAIRSVAITSDPDEPTPGFVDVLPRYSLRATDISLSFVGG